MLVVGGGSQARFDGNNQNLGAGAGGRMFYLANIPISILGSTIENVEFNYVSGTYHRISVVSTQIGVVFAGGYAYNTSDGNMSFGNITGTLEDYLIQTSATGGGASEIYSYAGAGFCGAGGGGTRGEGQSVNRDTSLESAGGTGGDGRGGYAGGYTYSVSNGCRGYYRNNNIIPLQSIFDGTGYGGNGRRDNLNGAGGGGGGYGNGSSAINPGGAAGYGGGGSVYNNNPFEEGLGIICFYYHNEELSI